MFRASLSLGFMTVTSLFPPGDPLWSCGGQDRTHILPQGYIFLWRLSSVKEFVKYFLTSKSDVFPSTTGSVSKESTCTAGDLGSIPGLGRSPGGGHGNPQQYSCLENPRGQRSLVGCSPWGRRVRHDRAQHYPGNWLPFRLLEKITSKCHFCIFEDSPGKFNVN